MATTLTGGNGTDVILPEGVTTDQVGVTTSDDGETLVVVKEKTSGIDIEAADDTAISGRKLTDSEVNVSGAKGDTTKVVLETTVLKDSTITNQGKGALEVNVNTGKVKNLTVDAGNKKRDDVVRIRQDVKLVKSTFDMGKGDDTVRFSKGTTFKGKNTIDLGPGGKDSIVIKADEVAPGKLIVTSFSKKDTIKIGEETFTYKDIKNGAEIPGVKVELA